MYSQSLLLERDKAGRLGTTDTGATVLGGLVGDGELAEVVTDHLSTNFDVGELLTVVDTNNGANHLGDDDDITEVGLDDGGLLVFASLTLGLAQLLEEGNAERKINPQIKENEEAG